MTPVKAKAVVAYCEGRTTRGTPCKREAGWGTDHVGRGRCKLHLGSTKNHRRKAAREEAREFLLGWDGALAAIDPLDAAVKAVELAHGRVEHTREKMLDVYLEGGEPSPDEHERYRLALQDLSRMTEAANRAGVADRMAALTERAVDQVSLAFEQASIAMKLDAVTRAIGVKAFAEALGRAEDDGPPQLEP